MRIAVLDDWQGVAEAYADWAPVKAKAEVVFFHDFLGANDQAAEALKDFDAVVLLRERTPFDVAMLDTLPRLKLICVTGGPPTSLDIAGVTARGVVVCGTQATGPYSPTATAELAFGLMLAAKRNLPAGDAAIRGGGFQAAVPPGDNLEGLTLGLVGLGNIGARVAHYAKAFGMNVVAWSPNLTDERAAEVGARKLAKAELMAQADIISLHLKLSERSKGTIGAADIAQMKRGALLVNTSRGPLIDEAAMLAALNEGRIRAALDVFDEEPLPAGHPLRTAKGTVLSPHLGYVTSWTFKFFYGQTAENLAAFIDGEPIRVMNKDVLESPQRR